MDQKRKKNVVKKYSAKYIWDKVFDAICHFDVDAVAEMTAFETEQKTMTSKKSKPSLRWYDACADPRYVRRRSKPA